MKRVAAAFLGSLVVAGCTAQNIGFVPKSYLSAEEERANNEQLKTEMDWTDEDLKRMKVGKSFTYRENDIRSAFPEVQDSDSLMSSCANSMMGGATQIVFLSAPIDSKRVRIKRASCRPVTDGLSCGPLEVETKYFFRSREHYFDVLFGTELDDALSVLAAYESGGISGLPDWYERVYSVTDVTAVGRTTNGFILHVGDIYCGGCTAKLLVTTGPDPSGGAFRLVFVDALDSICI